MGVSIIFSPVLKGVSCKFLSGMHVCSFLVFMPLFQHIYDVSEIQKSILQAKNDTPLKYYMKGYRD